MNPRLPGLEPVNIGRLFKLKAARNLAARVDALASIRELPRGGWQVRIGGRLKGRTEQFRTRPEAVAAVHSHYNALMHAFIQTHRRINYAQPTRANF